VTDASTSTVRAHDLVSDYLSAAFQRFATHEEAIRTGGDAEDLHQARVGIRRMRCALRTYRPVFDRLWARSVRNAAVLFAYPMGRVRDADVVLDRERPHIADDARVLVDALTAIRDVRRQHLLDTLNSEQAAETLELMRDSVARPRLIAGAGTTVDDLLPSTRSAWRKVRKAVRRLGTDPSDPDLHRVRILTKRARYASELIRPVVGEDARRFCKAAGVLQDALGELQDAAVARAWLFELIPTLDPDGAREAHRLANAELERARDARTAWHAPWDVLSDDATSGWLQA
jgi:CHAD domain-containing protein